MKTPLLIAFGLSLFLFGCASAPDATGEGVEEPVVTVDLERRPLVLDSDAELEAFVREFSLVVEEAEGVRRDLVAGSVEEEVARIETLRGHLEKWRGISEDAVLNPETSEISAEGYERFMADLAVLRSRLWDIVREINREIAEATGVAPV